jgi:hypothetical protein
MNMIGHEAIDQHVECLFVRRSLELGQHEFDDVGFSKERLSFMRFERHEVAHTTDIRECAAEGRVRMNHARRLAGFVPSRFA